MLRRRRHCSRCACARPSTRASLHSSESSGSRFFARSRQTNEEGSGRGWFRHQGGKFLAILAEVELAAALLDDPGTHHRVELSLDRRLVRNPNTLSNVGLKLPEGPRGDGEAAKNRLLIIARRSGRLLSRADGSRRGGLALRSLGHLYTLRNSRPSA